MKFNSQPSPRALLSFSLALFLCAPGCFTPLVGESTDPSTAKRTSPPTAAAKDADSKPANGADFLADDQWIMSVPNKADRSPIAYRWRNPSLEKLLVMPGDTQQILEAGLGEGGIRGANAAILLARSHRAEAAPALVRAIEDPTLKQPIRRAAAEALAALPPEIAVKNLHAAMAGIERKVGISQPAYNADLHAELLMALTQHRSADDEPAFARALERDELPAKLTALEHWAMPGKTPLPEKAFELCQDSDARVRAAAIRAVIARPDDQTEAQLQRASRDPVIDVKLTAIDALGKLRTPAARKSLDRAFGHEGELVRAAALNALVQSGAVEMVAVAAKDKSWRVRLAAAQNLSELPPDEQTLAMAKMLLTDPSGDVQRAVIAAVATWPLPAAGPIWLNALENAGYLGRKAAARQLAEYWPPAKAYSADAPNERRAARLAELREKWRQEFGEGNATAATKMDGSRARAAVAGVVEVASAIAPIDSIKKLRSNDLEERRRGAKELVQFAAQQTVAPELFAELSPLIAAEQDATIWQSVFSLLANDERPAAAELACAALSHPSADVRRRACEHLAAHGRPENAAALVASLADEHVAVQIAAAKALGHIGSARDFPALTHLLLANDKIVRVAAAVSLLELGAPEGVAALERLSYDNDEKVRREVVEAMDRSANREFVPALVRLLDDRASVKRATVAALEHIVGPAAKDPSDATSETADDSARRWKRWFTEGTPPQAP